MRNVLFITLLLLIAASKHSFGQNLEIGNNFYFIATGGIPSGEDGLKLDGADVLPDSVQITANHRITISYTTDDRVFFRYLTFNDPTLKRLYNKQENGITEKMFSLSKAQFQELTNPYYDRFRGVAYGVYSVPIRLRNAKVEDDREFEFDANATVGASITPRFSYRRRLQYPYIELPVSIAVTSVALNPDNSGLGTVEAYREIESLSPAAFTVSLGLIIHYTPNVNFGLYLGKDWLSSSDQEVDWIYNGRSWLGLGVNFTLSSANDQNNEGEN